MWDILFFFFFGSPFLDSYLNSFLHNQLLSFPSAPTVCLDTLIGHEAGFLKAGESFCVHSGPCEVALVASRALLSRASVRYWNASSGLGLWGQQLRLPGKQVSLLEAPFMSANNWPITDSIHRPQPRDSSLLTRITSTLRG